MTSYDEGTPPPLEIGFILSAHGLRGEIKARLHNPDSNALETLEALCIRTRVGKEEMYKIRYVHPQPKKTFILALDGIKDRNMAETLKGATLWANQGDLQELEKNEFFLASIRGFEAFDENHGPLGRIKGFIFTNIDILDIRDGEGNEVLLPLLEDTVLEINSETRTIRLRIPEGLLDE